MKQTTGPGITQTNVKTKARAATVGPQTLQLARRMVRTWKREYEVLFDWDSRLACSLSAQQTVDEMKAWYKATLKSEKESPVVIPIPGFTRLRRLGKGTKQLT